VLLFPLRGWGVDFAGARGGSIGGNDSQYKFTLVETRHR